MSCDFNVDDLDIFIIQEISNGNESTWNIAKKYFTEGKITNRFLDAKSNLIKLRLKKMEKWGLVHIKKDNWANEYQLIKEYFKLGRHKFQDGYFDSIQLKISGSWVVFQI